MSGWMFLLAYFVINAGLLWWLAQAGALDLVLDHRKNTDDNYPDISDEKAKIQVCIVFMLLGLPLVIAVLIMNNKEK